MQHKTQGSELYVRNTTISPPEVLKIGQLVDINNLGGQASDIDVTDLDAQRFKEFLSGLIDPGSAAIGINFDSASLAHQFLNDNAGGDQFDWAIGLSNGFGIPPTQNTGNTAFELPSTRAWLTFTASVHMQQFAFAVDSVVKFNSALRLSGEITVTPKA